MIGLQIQIAKKMQMLQVIPYGQPNKVLSATVSLLIPTMFGNLIHNVLRSQMPKQIPIKNQELTKSQLSLLNNSCDQVPLKIYR